MSVVRKVARPMLAAIFVVQGFKKLRDPDAVADRAQPVADRMAPVLEKAKLPTDARTLVRISGAVDMTAGAALATSTFPRIASLVLAGSLVPTTIAGHPFWQSKDPRERAEHRVHFLKNVGLAGGLLVAGVDTEGRPGLRWRAKHAAADTRKAAKAATREAKLAARATRAEAARKARDILPA